MCGIAGWLRWEQPPDAGIVRAITDRMVHRGPDAGNTVSMGPVVFGHRRLSIIDIGHDNDQPLYDTSGQYIIVFNGEIYNFQELRQRLEKSRAVFRTRGDTEVILEAYKHWGFECPLHFNGMFAFAIWDLRQQTLFMARDRLGEKPLFYTEFGRNNIAFASEPGALSLHPEIGRDVDPVALGQYLSLNYTPGERSLYRGIKKLLPGHILIAARDKPLIRRSYWDLAEHFMNKREDLTERSAAETLQGLIDDSTRLRLVSDVPLGAFLSGGVDSASIVAAMTAVSGGQPVKTFSVGFEYESYNELEQARETAAVFGSEFHEELMSPSEDDIVRALVHAIDEPLADTSVLPTYQLARFARRTIKVALSGDGGDECFGGYETYIADRLHHYLGRIPAVFSRQLHHAVDRFWPVSFEKISLDYKLRQFLAGLSLSPDQAHYSWREIFSKGQLTGILRPEVSELIHGADEEALDIFLSHAGKVSNCHYLDRAMYTDIKTWLVDDILVKVDRATMANSLEARVPLLDHRIVEFAASLPVSFRIKGLQKKYILKKSQADRLPAAIFSRKKQGFNAPVSYWLGGPLKSLAYETLHDPAVQQWLNIDKVDQLWRELMNRKRDNGLKLFGLLCFGLWLKQR